VAKKIIFVSDLSGKEIDPKDAVRVTVSYADARRGTVVVDAHESDAEVQRLVAVGTKQARLAAISTAPRAPARETRDRVGSSLNAVRAPSHRRQPDRAGRTRPTRRTFLPARR
jgi:hypothetical protein